MRTRRLARLNSERLSRDYPDALRAVRRLIPSVWHANPLRYPVCENPTRVIAVIDDPRVVEKTLLRTLTQRAALWQCGIVLSESENKVSFSPPSHMFTACRWSLEERVK